MKTKDLIRSELDAHFAAETDPTYEQTLPEMPKIRDMGDGNYRLSVRDSHTEFNVPPHNEDAARANIRVAIHALFELVQWQRFGPYAGDKLDLAEVARVHQRCHNWGAAAGMDEDGWETVFRDAMAHVSEAADPGPDGYMIVALKSAEQSIRDWHAPAATETPA